MNIAQFFIALHCCVQNLHFLHFRAKFACPCIPKLMSHIRLWVYRFLIIYQLPKSNCMNHRTQHPLLYVSKDYSAFCFHTFQDYNVFSYLCFQILQCLQSFTFTRLQCLQSFTLSTFSHLHLQDYNFFSHLLFQRLQCLQSFTFTRL